MTGGNIGVDGPTGEGSRHSYIRGGNSYTDSRSAITEIAQYVKIKGKMTKGHYDVNGLPVEGPMKINNLRIYDESRLVDKLQLIALTYNISDNEWLNEKKALLVDEYINHQEASCIKKGYGYVYEPSFFNIE